ncbi:tetraacyldisaccharide 4'-kinase [Flavobacterium sp. ANB]|uniref:tetraacyldisaccharide 4'-kinase n=1 Tax=unclassified Flavobacterium TaxID=196869 RepID=UPI0012B90205|nr:MULTISPECIES: tetraacyldisaccharide 4'-kinase [unclassified Flavobacterium]MBF4517503.1 tetraacyldisaccharide 4'-kinase [Flavobacterium sp. ANB]MTD72133.1 tetraacyldisaccharide 4'-kinase [Flavobacterium sp. LC2016-13]
MNLLRKILFPFAILYGFITSIRNYLFDKGVLKSSSFDIPVIAVGNLSVGGTGKTPQIEYLIRLLSDKYKIATLSRGYKRKSEGFVLADSTSNAEILGDEPFQFYQKFPNIQVAVDANRTNGITQLLSQKEKPEIVLLDDAYQHRKVEAGFYILLTSYGDLYADDFMLPTGNLRESRSGANRAKIVIVTKCPKNLSDQEQNEIRLKLKLTCSQQIFFTFIDYDNEIYSKDEKITVSEIKNEPKLLLAGIAKPKPFFDYLNNENDECLTYPDHHHFSEGDLDEVQKKAENKKIITTEKDYVRLKDSKLVSQLYYLPIKSTFINNKQNFDATILEYIKTNSAT